MGLPTSFGKRPGSLNKMAAQKKFVIFFPVWQFKWTVTVYRSRGTNAIRQQVKAALDLIGVEYTQSGDTLTGGKVEYKLRQIGSQNKRLKFGTQPKHVRFDDEGNEVSVIEPDEEEAEVETCESQPVQEEVVVKPQKRRKRKKKSIPYPAEMETNNRIKKFWSRRFSLFSKFDEGIKLDEGKNNTTNTFNL